MDLVPVTQRLAGTIEVFDNAVPNSGQVLDEVLRLGEWQDALVGEHLVRNDTIRDSSVYWIPAFDFRNTDILYQFVRTVWHYIDDYGIRYNRAFSGIENINVNRYLPGQQYHAHADAGGKSTRVISALVYLNDDFTGGQTEFIHHGIAVTPEAGRLVVFPSDFSYSHAALPPNEGVKYSAACWAFA